MGLGQKKTSILSIIYIFCIAVAALGDQKTLPVSIKLATVGIIAVGLVVLIVSGDFKNLKKIGMFMGMYVVMMAGILLWSQLLWIGNLQETGFILRGFTKMGYQFITFGTIASGAYLFGERAIHNTCWGLIIGNAAIAAIDCAICGVSNTISDIMTFVTTFGTQTGFMNWVEIHDITFAFGLFLIYFLFYAEHTKERIVLIILSIFFFILGWKRIAAIAVPIVGIVGFLLGRIRKSEHRLICLKIIGILVVVICFAYVVAVYYNLFDYLSKEYGINVMGRNDIYDYIRQYYSISPSYIGCGFEYTSVILQEIADSGVTGVSGILAVHNNILVEYIELGFWGFIVWLVYIWVFQLRHIISNCDEKTATLYVMCELYAFITYATDNTLFYFFTSMVLRLIPMAFAIRDERKRKKKYNLNQFAEEAEKNIIYRRNRVPVKREET